jgi:hypothetical protein
MLLAFGIIFGALMLGLALAFGLGGRELARQYLQKRFGQGKPDDQDDELSPL